MNNAQTKAVSTLLKSYMTLLPLTNVYHCAFIRKGGGFLHDFKPFSALRRSILKRNLLGFKGNNYYSRPNCSSVAAQGSSP